MYNARPHMVSVND